MNPTSFVTAKRPPMEFSGIITNPSRSSLIRDCVERREAIVTKTDALATWMRRGETGRIPKETYIVRDRITKETVDWGAPTSNAMEPQLFDALLEHALLVLSTKPRVYELHRAIGADPSYALAVRVITDRALDALYCDTMFRPVMDANGFTLVILPADKIQPEKFPGLQDMAIAMDFERKIGIVYGCAYLGAIKKVMFTVTNYLLPPLGILPLHASANEDREGNVALFLGLSGTGKTTLSHDPSRALIGDDEHGWGDSGIANFEGGCYVKLVNLSEIREPDVYRAVFTSLPLLENGVIIDNAMVFPDGSIDLCDSRLTENSRASYPLSYLGIAKKEARGGHPETILFLTADASGVLPPVAKLSPPDALRWFLLGYTSKLAGTETGVTKPVSTFSRFFGAPFMPRHSRDYMDLLAAKLAMHGTEVFLVNTGWTGGPYGVGKRMDIAVSRAIVDAALRGALRDIPCEEDPRFHLAIPRECPGVHTNILTPKNTWSDPEEYERAANELAGEFAKNLTNLTTKRS